MAENRRILFLTNSELGQANVFLAVIRELASLGAPVDLHVGSFAPLRRLIADLPVPAAFHEIEGATWQDALFKRPEHHFAEYTGKRPTIWNAAESASIMPRVACPWNPEEMGAMVRKIQGFIETLEPDLVVIDNLLAPAVTVCYPLKETKWMVLSPNTYKEFIVVAQPRLQVLWKHSPPRSVMPFPVPLHLIPSAVYQTLCYAKNFWSPWVHEHVAYLNKNNGIEYSDWGRLNIPPPGLKILVPSRPEVDFHFDLIPPHIVSCGPIVLPGRPLEEADPELASWLSRHPTLYINLGTHASSDDRGVAELVGALKHLLNEAKGKGENLQVLWKLKETATASSGAPSKGISEVSSLLGDEFAHLVRVTAWLDAEPVSILNSGHIVCSLNHGGANSYWEAISASVPQVVTPVWYDTYDFAQRVEYLGIGKFGSKKAAPRWTADELGPILVHVILGEKSAEIKARAKKLGEICRQNGGGRAIAARAILDELKA